MRYDWTPAAIHALRLELRLSRRDFAAITGVSRQAVQQWEAGERSPSGVRTHALTAIKRLLDEGHMPTSKLVTR